MASMHIYAYWGVAAASAAKWRLALQDALFRCPIKAFSTSSNPALSLTSMNSAPVAFVSSLTDRCGVRPPGGSNTSRVNHVVVEGGLYGQLKKSAEVDGDKVAYHCLNRTPVSQQPTTTYNQLLLDVNKVRKPMARTRQHLIPASDWQKADVTQRSRAFSLHFFIQSILPPHRVIPRRSRRQLRARRAARRRVRGRPCPHCQ